MTSWIFVYWRAESAEAALDTAELRPHRQQIQPFALARRSSSPFAAFRRDRPASHRLSAHRFSAAADGCLASCVRGFERRRSRIGRRRNVFSARGISTVS